MKMKLLALAAIGALALTSCSGGSKAGDEQKDSAADNTTVQDAPQEVVETYAGVLPQADGSGVAYTLTLTYDPQSDNMTGTYEMVQVYDNAEQSTFKSAGAFNVGQQDGKKYMKLQNKADETDVYYFLVDSDQAITMVGQDLQPSVTGENYTLNKK